MTAVAIRRNACVALVVGARDAHRRGGRGLGLDREVGEHVLHRGWSASSLPNALRWRAWCTACATPQRIAGGRADQAVEPRVVDHPDDRRRRRGPPRRPAGRARRGTRPRDDGSERVPSLSFSRWIRKPGSRPSTRKHERPPGACASVRKTSHGRIRAEPLVAGDLVRAVAVRLGAGGVGAHVRAALLLGHRHARRARRRRSSGSVRRGSHSAASSGVLAQRRDRRVGHRDRAHHAGVRPGSRAMNSAARTTCAPGCGSRHGSDVDLALDRLAQHQCQDGSSSTSSMRLP